MSCSQHDQGEQADGFAAPPDDPGTTNAAVGTTDGPAKHGGLFHRNLKGKGFKVPAVNPGRDTVDGDPCYPSVAQLPDAPTIVDTVVPPGAALECCGNASP
ncbi:MAG: CoA-binding protein [Actinomycetota bacterium]